MTICILWPPFFILQKIYVEVFIVVYPAISCKKKKELATATKLEDFMVTFSFPSLSLSLSLSDLRFTLYSSIV